MADTYPALTDLPASCVTNEQTGGIAEELGGTFQVRDATTGVRCVIDVSMKASFDDVLLDDE